MKKIIIFSLIVGTLYYFLGHTSVSSFVRRNSTFSSVGSFAANALQGTRDFVYERVANVVTPSIKKAKDAAREETYHTADIVSKKGVVALGNILGIKEQDKEKAINQVVKQEPIIFLDKTLLSGKVKANIVSGKTLEAAVTFCSVYNKGEEIRSTLRVFRGGNDDSYNSYMDWGDGKRTDLGALPEGRDISLSHIYTKSGEFTVTLHVSDGKEEYSHKRSVCIR